MTSDPGEFTAYARSLGDMEREQLISEARRWRFSTLTLRDRERAVMMSADPLLAVDRGRLAKIWALISLRRATVRTEGLLAILRGDGPEDPGVAEYGRSLEDMDRGQLEGEARRWRFEAEDLRQRGKAIAESADALLATCLGAGHAQEPGRGSVLGIRAGDAAGPALSAEDAATRLRTGTEPVAVTALGPDGQPAPETETIVHPRPGHTEGPRVSWAGGGHQDLASAAAAAKALTLATRLASAAPGVRPPGQDLAAVTADVPLTSEHLTLLMQALNGESERAENQGDRNWARRAIELSNLLLGVRSQLLPPAVSAPGPETEQPAAEARRDNAAEVHEMEM